MLPCLFSSSSSDDFVSSCGWMGGEPLCHLLNETPHAATYPCPTEAITNSLTSKPTIPLTTHPATDVATSNQPASDPTGPDHVMITTINEEETGAQPTQKFSSDSHFPVEEGTTDDDPSGDEKNITPLIAGVTVGVLVLVILLSLIVLALGIGMKSFKKQIAHGTTIDMKDNSTNSTIHGIATTLNDSYAHSAEMKENAAYGPPSGINVFINESYATNTIMATNPAYNTHARDDDHTYAAIGEAVDEHTLPQLE